MTNRRIHNALSLLEVMIAIGIVAVGILGILAILPVAGFRAQQGDRHLRTAETGENATAKFKTLGMRQPANWLLADGVTAAPAAGRQPYAIDPVHVAVFANAGQVSPNIGGGGMPRLTLRRGPLMNGLSRLQAEEIFVEQNDLAFQANPDSAQPPLQDVVLDGSGNPMKRESEGRFSWLATIVPNPRAAGNVDPEETYTLSIVIFENRIILPDDPATAAVDEGADKTASVVNFYSGGIGGGDVQISTTDPNSVTALTELKEGHWVMLTGPQAGNGIFRWYRVIHTDPDLSTDASGNPARDVTLEGPDWSPSVAASVWLPETAIGVYERAIRLETPSNIWAN